MRIGNVYRPVIFGCRADERLCEVAARMVEKKVGSLAVLEGDQVTGIITERDLAAALAASADPTSVNAAAYASTEVKTAGLEEDSRDAGCWRRAFATYPWTGKDAWSAWCRCVICSPWRPGHRRCREVLCGESAAAGACF